MNDPGAVNLEEHEVAIASGSRTLRGTLSQPRGASAAVILVFSRYGSRYPLGLEASVWYQRGSPVGSVSMVRSPKPRTP